MVRALNVGDSFVCETSSQKDCARHVMRHLGWKYATRKMAEGWRVWRTE